MKERALLSIIITVYNRESSIEKIIYSILEQEDTTCELIIVDDGSNDKTYSICKELQHKFKMHVEVVTKRNGGASSARNAGLALASGKYVCFIDSDDSIEKNYITVLKELCQKGYDLYQMDYRIGNDKNGYRTVRCGLPYGEVALESFYEHVLCQRSNEPWSKIYNSDIIKENNIAFDTSLTIGEDVCFSLRFLEYCSDCFIADVAPYNYLINPDGLCNSEKLTYLNDIDEMFVRMKAFINMKKLSDKYYCDAARYVMRSYYRNIGHLVRKGFKKAEIEAVLGTTTSLVEVLNVENNGFFDRLRVFLLRHKHYELISKMLKN